MTSRLSFAGDQTPEFDFAALLGELGIVAVVVSCEADLESLNSDPSPHLALVDISSMTEPDLGHCVQRCLQMKLPTIALVPEERVGDLGASPGVDDFVVMPPMVDELVTRAKLVLWRARSLEGSDVIRNGDLVISPANYEVSLKGMRINLRFKEYELLLLLASNPGRVYTREALLSRIWGYDYFRGTRTVDVHIRRLRSKIGDAEHSFIETIWNVGYRFKA